MVVWRCFKNVAVGPGRALVTTQAGAFLRHFDANLVPEGAAFDTWAHTQLAAFISRLIDDEWNEAKTSWEEIVIPISTLFVLYPFPLKEFVRFIGIWFEDDYAAKTWLANTIIEGTTLLHEKCVVDSPKEHINDWYTRLHGYLKRVTEE